MIQSYIQQLQRHGIQITSSQNLIQAVIDGYIGDTRIDMQAFF